MNSLKRYATTKGMKNWEEKKERKKKTGVVERPSYPTRRRTQLLIVYNLMQSDGNLFNLIAIKYNWVQVGKNNPKTFRMWITIHFEIMF